MGKGIDGRSRPRSAGRRCLAAVDQLPPAAWLPRGGRVARIRDQGGIAAPPCRGGSCCSDWRWQEYQLGYFSAVDRTMVATATLLAVCTAPLFVALVARWAFGERLTFRVTGALVFGLAGTILMIGIDSLAGLVTSRRWSGNALALARRDMLRRVHLDRKAFDWRIAADSHRRRRLHSRSGLSAPFPPLSRPFLGSMGDHPLSGARFPRASPTCFTSPG